MAVRSIVKVFQIATQTLYRWLKRTTAERAIGAKQVDDIAQRMVLGRRRKLSVEITANRKTNENNGVTRSQILTRSQKAQSSEEVSNGHNNKYIEQCTHVAYLTFQRSSPHACVCVCD